jgi:hypothetical protein
MVANELTRFGISFVIVYSTDVEKFIEKAGFVNTEVGGKQTPRRNECACLK